MKLSPIAVCRSRISPGPGEGGATSATSSLSAPPGAVMRTTMAMASSSSWTGSEPSLRRGGIVRNSPVLHLGCEELHMFDWEDLRHFAALARENSLSAAARRLGVDHATVARRIGALEAALGLRLVDRRPRSYALTADGTRIAALAARVETE